MFSLLSSFFQLKSSVSTSILLAQQRLRETRRLVRCRGKKFERHKNELAGLLKATQLNFADEIPEIKGIDLSPVEELRGNAETFIALLQGYIRKNERPLSRRGLVAAVFGGLLIALGCVLLMIVALSFIPQTSHIVQPIFAWIRRSEIMDNTKAFELIAPMIALGVASISGGVALCRKAKKSKYT